MKPLFGYGTFRKTAWRNAILGAGYPAQPATLRGYRRIAVASGYLSLRETVIDIKLVAGVLIELDEIGWRIADHWEEVPKYRRIDVAVNTMSGPVDAQAYVYTLSDDGTVVDDDSHALIADSEVDVAIERFATGMRRLRRGESFESDDG